jgi:hypothetical protein
MYAAGNGVRFGSYGAAALGRSLTALASLRELDIGCKPRTSSVQILLRVLKFVMGWWGDEFKRSRFVGS